MACRQAGYTSLLAAYALLQNADGAWPVPNEASFKAAAAHADWNKAKFYEILTNEPGKDSWPITGATFILMHKIQDNGASCRSVEVLRVEVLKR